MATKIVCNVFNYIIINLINKVNYEINLYINLTYTFRFVFQIK